MTDKVNAKHCAYEKATENELNTCKYIARFGGLTSRQLAKLVWPGASQGMRMAQRTCKRLMMDKRIISRDLPNGGIVYVLAERGARWLKQYGMTDLNSRGQRDLKFDKPVHRMISNNYLIGHYLDDNQIWTEHEIQTAQAPVPDIKIGGHKKIPDGLMMIDGGLFWIEVENAPKPKKRLNELMDLAEYLFLQNSGSYYRFNHKGNDYYINAIQFLIPNEASMRATYKAIYERFAHSSLGIELQLILVKITSGYLWYGKKFEIHANELERYGKDPFE